MKFIVLFSAALVAGVFSAQAATQNVATQTNANSEAALFGDPAVVKARGFEIKHSELDQVVSGARANALASGQQLPPEFEVSVLNQLITIQVLLQMANPADKVVGQQEADSQYTNLLAKFVSPEAFDRQLKAAGITVTELRAKAVQEATAKAALKRLLNINFTDEESKDYYNQHPAEFEQPELVHARHIVLLTIDPTTHMPLSSNTIAAKRQQIDDIRKKLLAGADFATLAKENSEDGSKHNGGELPEFSRGQMMAEFESAAFALGTNQISEVVTAPYGYHLIKVLDKTPAKKIDFITANPKIKDFLAGRKIGKLAPDYVKKLREDQKVEILDSKLKALDEQLQIQAAMSAAATAADAADAPTNK